VGLVKFYAKSDKGNVRDQNEDYFGVVYDKNDEPYVFIIADGMGGYNGGDIASKLAVKTLQDFFNEKFDLSMIVKKYLVC
jgi:serine/threonine protein phosphatase PrpC